MTEFEKIYRTYFNDVFLYIRQLSKDEHIAEEIVSETFFKAMRSISRFRGDCDIRVWLCQIAKNCYYSYVKNAGRIERIEDIELLNIPTQDETVEEQLTRQDEAAQIQKLLHDLPEPYKECFMWRVFAELSFKQIAQIFGKSENWACVTYHRARKMRAKKIQTAAFTAILVIAVLVSAFAFMSAPEYFSYSADLLSITETADKSITITFAEKVTDYSCNFYLDPAAEIGSIEKGRYYYHIEAWTSLWDRWFSSRGVQSTTIQPKEDLPFTVYYVSNNNEEDVCLYGQPLTENGGVITLPRLTLGYYLILAFVCFGGLLIVRFVFKRRESIKIWTERIMMYPISYVSGHFVVLGSKSTSYSMQRDFMLIIFLSVLIYCGLLLAHNIYQLRKELKEIDAK